MRARRKPAKRAATATRQVCVLPSGLVRSRLDATRPISLGSTRPAHRRALLGPRAARQPLVIECRTSSSSWLDSTRLAWLLAARYQRARLVPFAFPYETSIHTWLLADAAEALFIARRRSALRHTARHTALPRITPSRAECGKLSAFPYPTLSTSSRMRSLPSPRRARLCLASCCAPRKWDGEPHSSFTFAFHCLSSVRLSMRCRQRMQTVVLATAIRSKNNSLPCRERQHIARAQVRARTTRVCAASGFACMRAVCLRDGSHATQTQAHNCSIHIRHKYLCGARRQKKRGRRGKREDEDGEWKRDERLNATLDEGRQSQVVMGGS